MISPSSSREPLQDSIVDAVDCVVIEREDRPAKEKLCKLVDVRWGKGISREDSVNQSVKIGDGMNVCGQLDFGPVPLAV